MIVLKKTFCYQCWIGLLTLLLLSGCGGTPNTASSAPSPTASAAAPPVASPPSTPAPSPTPTPTPPPAPPAPPNPAAATLYTMSNQSSGNTVVAYKRNADGTLTQTGTFPTGGLGVGHGLENQGALALNEDGKFLFVVNPGSDDVSAFQITDQGLKLTARTSSGGRLPVSVTARGDVVYVLNRGGEASPPSTDNISGLRLGIDGSLTAIPGSTNQLGGANTNPAQIELSPNGNFIVVTEHGGGFIDTYTVDANGIAGGHQAQRSAGTGPFGFAFRNASQLLVSEAGGGTAPSYVIGAQGSLQTISAAVSTTQNATCWLVITPDQTEAYVANTVSGSISEFTIGGDGSLSLQASVSAKTQGGPLDMAITSDGSFLSVLTTAGNIEVFRIDPANGSLSQVQAITGLPAGTNGLVGF